ncbi:hypothetical protein L3X38_019080 [Prunus dulcis]|uniref:Uncharacterized protein n=1 Tax=Prunus dulcis TaxID=3755 RepID=A0AAD4WB72_PRUDU|nr:hypothetical protein L3X38_019080 [Prunus dulcis]
MTLALRLFGGLGLTFCSGLVLEIFLGSLEQIQRGAQARSWGEAKQKIQFQQATFAQAGCGTQEDGLARRQLENPRILGWNNVKFRLKLPPSPSPAPATSGPAITWIRYFQPADRINRDSIRGQFSVWYDSTLHLQSVFSHKIFLCNQMKSKYQYLMPQVEVI